MGQPRPGTQYSPRANDLLAYISSIYRFLNCWLLPGTCVNCNSISPALSLVSVVFLVRRQAC